MSAAAISRVDERMYYLRLKELHLRTSVLMANAGSHESGGIILQTPYFSPSGRIFLMYSNGSLNSCSVGLNVGASCKPCGLDLLCASRAAEGCPRLSTVAKSKGGALR